MEQITIQFRNPLLLDRLRTLSAEYNIPCESLIIVAVKHLLDDVEFIRSLRMGVVTLE